MFFKIQKSEKDELQSQFSQLNQQVFTLLYLHSCRLIHNKLLLIIFYLVNIILENSIVPCVEHRLWCLQIHEYWLKALLLLVCGFWVVWICNPLIELIQGCLILILLKKMCFKREVEKTTSYFIVSTGCFTLRVFERIWN